MSLATLIRRMAEAGAPPEAIALAVEEIEALQTSLDARRVADRDRKRAQRERQKSANVTGQSEDSPETVTNKSSLEVSPHTPLPKPSKQSPLNPPKLFVDAWNAIAEQFDLAKVSSVNGDRLRALKARIAEHGEQAVFDAIAAVGRSPHWRGENGWAGNFDSMLRPGNFRRLIEGSYEPPKSKTGPPEGSFLDHLREERRRTATT